MADLKRTTSFLLCLIHKHQPRQYVCSAGLQISGVVGEQELGLRQMLRTMGMLDSAYWLSWMLFEVQPHLCHSSHSLTCGCSSGCIVAGFPDTGAGQSQVLGGSQKMRLALPQSGWFWPLDAGNLHRVSLSYQYAVLP